MFNFLKKKLQSLRRTAQESMDEDEPGEGKAEPGGGKPDGKKPPAADGGAKKKKPMAPGPVRRRRRSGAGAGEVSGRESSGPEGGGGGVASAKAGAVPAEGAVKTEEEVKPEHITTSTAFPTRKKATRVARRAAGDGSGRIQGRQRDLVPEEAEGGLFAQEITEKRLEKVLAELEMALLEADVALPVVDLIKDELKKELVGRKIRRKYDMGDLIESALRTAISNALSAEMMDFNTYVRNHEKPVVLMFVGVNGSGKTTTIAKFIYRLKELGLSSVIAAGDTFRAGAIQQAEKHAANLGVRIIKHDFGSDPAAVAYDAVEHAKARNKDVVLIDTAGRMQTNINLMDEMKKIKRIAKPDMVIFVGDSLTGNDTVEQARKFNDAVNIDAAVLTKIDADAKGGAALSIAHAVGKPILFVGIGQEYNKLVAFNPRWMLDRLFEEGAAS